jgi:hypothetical protein
VHSTRQQGQSLSRVGTESRLCAVAGHRQPRPPWQTLSGCMRHTNILGQDRVVANPKMYEYSSKPVQNSIGSRSKEM